MKKSIVIKAVSLLILCSMVLGACSAGTAAETEVSSPQAAATPSPSPSPVTTGPLADIQSGDMATCQKGVDKLLNSYSEESFEGMFSGIASGSANMPVTVDRVISLASDPASTEKIRKNAGTALLGLCSGKGGDAARKLTLQDERTADAIITYTEGPEEGRNEYAEDYGIELGKLFSTGIFVKSRTNLSLVHYMLSYSIANDNFRTVLKSYFAETEDADAIGELLESYMIAADMSDDGDSNHYTTDSMIFYRETLEECKLSNAYLESWPDYFQSYGFEGVGYAYGSISSKIYTGTDNATFFNSENYIKIAELVPGFDKTSKKAFDYQFENTAGLDGSKVAVIEIEDAFDGDTEEYRFSPYSFISVPKDKMISVENISGAGVVVSVHFVYTYYAKYTRGVKGYRSDVVLRKIDLINGKVLKAVTIKGKSLPRKIRVDAGQKLYAGAPPTDEKIAKAVQDMLK